MRKLLIFLALAICLGASAKKIVITSANAFGFSASFTDSTVYFTNIRTADSLFMDNKTKFILGRENYSYQLKDYIENQLGGKNRTCVFFYNVNAKKLQKQYNKMREKYQGGSFIVKTISDSEFSFTPVDMSEQVDADEIKSKQKREKPEKGQRPRGGMPPGGDMKGMPQGGQMGGMPQGGGMR